MVSGTLFIIIIFFFPTAFLANKVVGKESDKYHFFQGGLNPRNKALNSGSQPGFDPELSALFRRFFAPLEKVVFV